MKREMHVKHAIEDGKHVVKIYPPGRKLEYLIGRWPVNESNERDVIDSLWSGYFEAADYVERFSADTIAVFSTDTAALEAFGVELREGK